MKIVIPLKYGNEISYVIDVLFSDILGIEDIEKSFDAALNETTIIAGNGSIKIRNHFFHGEWGNLFRKENLPESAKDGVHESQPFASLYGKPEVKQEGQHYIIHSDILASSFLLLSQWEAMLPHNKDSHGRLALTESVVGKFDLYQRPVINEYACVLKLILEKLGVEVKQPGYEAIFTCDVDSITKYTSIRNIFGALFHLRNDLGECIRSVKLYFTSKRSKINDPYYSFEYIIDKVRSKGIKAVFYFLVGKIHKWDTADYDMQDAEIKMVVKLLNESNFEIGIHPSYMSSERDDMIGNEINIIDKSILHKVQHSRQHFLRYRIDKTWNQLERLGIKFDSSVQFTEGLGFAAGICHPYHLYDIVSRKKLNLIEIPLLVMIKKDYAINYVRQINKIKEIIRLARYYNGKYMILFHNSNVETRKEKKFFEEVLALI